MTLFAVDLAMRTLKRVAGGFMIEPFETADGRPVDGVVLSTLVLSVTLLATLFELALGVETFIGANSVLKLTMFVTRQTLVVIC